MKLEMDVRTLPAGTLVHIQGIPCFLTAPAVLESGKSNWSVIEDAEAAEEAAINAADETGQAAPPRHCAHCFGTGLSAYNGYQKLTPEEVAAILEHPGVRERLTRVVGRSGVE